MASIQHDFFLYFSGSSNLKFPLSIFWGGIDALKLAEVCLSIIFITIINCTLTKDAITKSLIKVCPSFYKHQILSNDFAKNCDRIIILLPLLYF